MLLSTSEFLEGRGLLSSPLRLGGLIIPGTESVFDKSVFS